MFKTDRYWTWWFGKGNWFKIWWFWVSMLNFRGCILKYLVMFDLNFRMNMSLLLTHFSLANKNIRITQKYKVNKTYHVYNEVNWTIPIHPPGFSVGIPSIFVFSEKKSRQFFSEVWSYPCSKFFEGSGVIWKLYGVSSSVITATAKVLGSWTNTPGDGMMGYVAIRDF